MGNLTNAVIELQKLAVDHYGVTVEHPITLGEKEEGDEDAAKGDEAQQTGAGGDEGGNPPTVNLRGAGADGGEGGDGEAVGAGGYGARRVLTREKGGPEEDTGPAAAGDEPTAPRGVRAIPRRLQGSSHGEG